VSIQFVTYTLNGLGNQLASIQLLAGVAAALPDQEISAIYCKLKTGHKWAIQDPQEYQVDTSTWDAEFFDWSSPSLLEMLDYELPANVTVRDNDFEIKNRLNSNVINCQAAVLGRPDTTKEQYEKFSANKKPIHLDPSKNNVFTMSLIWYSKFFVDRPIEVDKEIAKIKFNSEYLEFVDMIKKDVGEYVGAHVRIMPDHHHVYKFSEEKYVEGLNSISISEKPLLLSVDDWNHEYVKAHNSKYINVHDLILNNYGKEFKSLSHHNRVDLATISMLLMAEASDFIGTYGSTYTSYIQQKRAQNLTEDWKFFRGTIHDSYDKNLKPYSWHSIPGGADLSWERDWDECKLRHDQF
jgi:hypothetical protein